MARQRARKAGGGNSKGFRVELLNEGQEMAYAAYKQHDVAFLVGPAGVGKSHCAMLFAIQEVLAKTKRKIVLTRPIVESGESLGYLPGDFHEKVNPYMMPLYDCLEKMVGREGSWRDSVDRSIEVAPLAYMRGRTFDDAVCIFDEAQNASKMQIKLFLSRLGKNSKMIVTGDPEQSDLNSRDESPLMDIVHRLETVVGVGIVEFTKSSIVRHDLVSKILERLE
tara:strand:+ start:722 stop:1390 length:669 start_codon:yes stop_codon:yes gene_type:complete